MVILGVWAIAILPIGLDAAVEVTYPAPEGTSTGISSSY